MFKSELTMDTTRESHAVKELRKRKTNTICDIPSTWNLKYGTNEPIYKIDSQTWRADLWLPRGGGWRGTDQRGVWG